MRGRSGLSPSADTAVTRERFNAALYDLDGVLTDETQIHAEMLS